MRHEKNTFTAHGGRIRSLRKQKGLTQAQLADLSGLERKTIQRAEQDEEMYPANLKRIAKALGASWQELVAPRENKRATGACESSRVRPPASMAEKTRHFVGRTFVFDAIAEFVKDNSCGYFVICGDPGIGKSSIAAKLVEREKCVYHFNSRVEGITRPEAFLTGVCAQLIDKYRIDCGELPHDATGDGRFLSKLLADVSMKLVGGKKAIVVVDALDEVDQVGQSSGANILYLPPILPKGVYFILTRRRMAAEVLPFFVQSPLSVLDLMDTQYERECRADVQEYIWDALKHPKLRKQVSLQDKSEEEFVEVLSDKSELNFMYLYYVLPEIERGTYKDLAIERLPAGLSGYYEDHWKRMQMMAKERPTAKLKIIYILSEVCEPVSRALVADFANEEEVCVQEVLDKWEQFLHKQVTDGEARFSVYHSSFRDFLKRKDIVKAAGVSIEGINRLIAENLFKEWAASRMQE